MYSMKSRQLYYDYGALYSWNDWWLVDGVEEWTPMISLVSTEVISIAGGKMND